MGKQAYLNNCWFELEKQIPLQDAMDLSKVLRKKEIIVEKILLNIKDELLVDVNYLDDQDRENLVEAFGNINKFKPFFE